MDYRPIRKLTDEVIGQIAAGEVVERPAAAVKELVENSIDAGATAVTVELTDGGLTTLRVSDNGRGIPPDQLRMAFERHATSKLVKAEELFDVRTLGFRGEALASIAAVAKVSCTTRTADAAFGVTAVVEAGDWVNVTEAASPQGTSIIVRDLFFNAPVRRKFLKKPVTEAALVSDYMLRLILSRPDVAFRFVNQGKTVYRSAGDGTLESAIYCVYGREALRAMRRVRGAAGGVLVDGYVGVGELSRGNRLQQSFFINGRYFRDELVSRALESGCEGFVMIGRYPVCALALQLPNQQVDVNVHPNKLEVRFQNPDAVFRAVEQLTRETLRAVTVEDALAGNKPAPEASPAGELQVVQLPTDSVAYAPADALPTQQTAAVAAKPAPPIQAALVDADTTAKESVPSGAVTAENPPKRSPQTSAMLREALPFNGVGWATDEPATEQALNQSEPPPEPAQGLPLTENSIAQPNPPIGNTPFSHESVVFSLAGARVAKPLPASPDAAAKAVPEMEQARMPGTESQVSLRYIGSVFQTYLLFEAGDRLLMVDQHAAHERVLYDRYMARYDGPNPSQRLLTPQLVRLTARDVALIEEQREVLLAAGIEVEAFDATSVAVRAVPVILGESEPIRDLLFYALDETQTRHGKLTRDRLRARVAQMACKHAIKAGDALNDEDVRALLMQMLATGAQPTCPHGRPIVNELNRRELEKRFRRIP